MRCGRGCGNVHLEPRDTVPKEGAKLSALLSWRDGTGNCFGYLDGDFGGDLSFQTEGFDSSLRHNGLLGSHPGNNAGQPYRHGIERAFPIL